MDPTVDGFLQESWEAVFGSSPESVRTLNMLVAEYSQPWRKYHGLTHIRNMLTLLRDKKPELCRSIPLNLAIWFHDFVLNPNWFGNERRSAQRAVACGAALGLEASVIAKANRMIRMTGRRPTHAEDAEVGFFLDLDYAILAGSPREYLAYASGIRCEVNALLRLTLFKKLRLGFLRATLARKTIFFSPELVELEARARANIFTEIMADAVLNRWQRDDRQPVMVVNGQLTRYALAADGAITEQRFAMSDIDKVIVCKRDLYAYDQIVMLLKCKDCCIVVPEDTLGAKQLFNELGQHLPGAIPFHQWFMAVAFPAFAANPTEIFARPR